MSNYSKIFDTTTSVRSSHVGQPEYNTNADWQHFCDKYQSRCIRFAESRFPFWREIARDAFQEVAYKIRVNPEVLARKPNARFRPILATLVRNAAAELLRQEKYKQRQEYARLTEPLREDGDTQESARKRLFCLAVDFIRRDLLRDDYENGRFAREMDTLDLDIWRSRQREGASNSSVAKEMGFSSGNKVRDAFARIEERIGKDAKALLVSLGLF